MPLLAVLSIIFSIILHKLVVALAALKSAILPLATFTASWTLQYCHKIPDIFE